MNTWNEVWKVTDNLIRSTSTVTAPTSTSRFLLSTTTSTTSSLIKIKVPLGTALKSFFSEEETYAKDDVFKKLDESINLTLTSTTISIVIVSVIAILGIVSMVATKIKSRKSKAMRQDILAIRRNILASAPIRELSEHVYQECNRINQCVISKNSLDSLTSTINVIDPAGSSVTVEDAIETV